MFGLPREHSLMLSAAAVYYQHCTNYFLVKLYFSKLKKLYLHQMKNNNNT